VEIVITNRELSLREAMIELQDKLIEMGEVIKVVIDEAKDEWNDKWDEIKEFMATMQKIDDEILIEEGIRDSWVIVRRYKNLHTMRKGDWTWQLRPRFRI
jgi:hypothetical protein